MLTKYLTREEGDLLNHRENKFLFSFGEFEGSFPLVARSGILLTDYDPSIF